ncbi:MAG TPA: YigZ family protein [Chloroflexia bacterium]|nr:YigZ family protein [Chloroflexia bacterium]
MTDPAVARMIPAARATAEIRAGNSRFVAQAAPTATVAEARAFIAETRSALPEATHHVYAYRIGHGATTTEGQSDAGEPSGTAGRPMLAVLRGSGLGDLTVVVSRYFGGTLLGTGGLVRAYGDAAKAVVAVLPRAEKIAYVRLAVTVPYSSYETACRQVATHAGTLVDEIFAVAVHLNIRLPATAAASFMEDLTETTAGQARIVPDATEVAGNG